MNRYKIVDSLSPADRWPNRKDESGLRTVPQNVYRPPTRAMARLASDGRVCIQQQDAN